MNFVLVLTVSSCLYIIIHKLFETIITTSLVVPIFQYVKTEIITDMAWYSLLVVFFVFISGKRIRPVQSLKLTILLLTVSVGYIVYRNGDTWIFYPLETLSFFRYADLLPIYTSFSVLSWTVYFLDLKRNPNQNSPNGFYEDLPISSLDEDTYNLQYYVNQLSSRIKSTFPKRSFCIGING
ncbi:unnamed protein product [Ectocarpus fasciculatus]